MNYPQNDNTVQGGFAILSCWCLCGYLGYDFFKTLR